MGANDVQTLQAFREAEEYPGPSLVIAYSHCIAHGYDLCHGMEQQKEAVASGYWPLLRFDPRLSAAGKAALVLDSKRPQFPLATFEGHESRFTMLERSHPEAAKAMFELAEHDIHARWHRYEQLASAMASEAIEAKRS